MATVYLTAQGVICESYRSFLARLLELSVEARPSGVKGLTLAAFVGNLDLTPFRGSLTAPRPLIKLRRSLDTAGLTLSVTRGEFTPARSNKLLGVRGESKSRNAHSEGGVTGQFSSFVPTLTGEAKFPFTGLEKPWSMKSSKASSDRSSSPSWNSSSNDKIRDLIKDISLSVTQTALSRFRSEMQLSGSSLCSRKPPQSKPNVESNPQPKQIVCKYDAFSLTNEWASWSRDAKFDVSAGKFRKDHVAPGSRSKYLAQVEDWSC